MVSYLVGLNKPFGQGVGRVEHDTSLTVRDIAYIHLKVEVLPLLLVLHHFKLLFNDKLMIS